MKKRNLITLVLLVSLSGILLTAMRPLAQAPSGKNIGLQLYSIRDSIMKNVPAAIKKVAAMGYKFVEPANYNDGKIYGMDPAAFKALCKKNGMFVICAHVNHGLPKDDKEWNEAMAWWDKCIDTHVAVGAKYLVQPSMGNEAYTSLETLKKYCDYFNAIGAKCAAKGLKFGYHNHNKEFSTKLEGQTVYDYMLTHTDPKRVFFEIDLYWCVEGGANPVDYFNKYPGRFLLWHIKDEKEIGDSGKMDFKSYWAEANKSGLQYGIVEVERYNFDEFTSCKKSIDFLNAQDYVVMPK